MTWAIAYVIGFYVTWVVLRAVEWALYREDGLPILLLKALVWPVVLPGALGDLIGTTIRKIGK
jgi:hypothetical protein